jgi:O-antigen ligase
LASAGGRLGEGRGAINRSLTIPRTPRASWAVRLGFSSEGAGWPIVLWVLLWGNCNSGPWHLKSVPSSATELMNAGRAAIPFLVLPAALSLWRKRGPSVRRTTPAHVWVAYAVLCAVFGAIDQGGPFNAVYWLAAYAGAFVIAMVCLQRAEVSSAAALNRVTWLLATIVITVLTIAARDVLVEGEGLGASAYGVTERMGDVAGMAMSLPTGMARFAAVPGLVGFGLLLRGRGIWRILGAAVFVGGAVFMYIMQSRGATAGYAAASLLMVWFSSRRGWILGVAIGIAIAGAVMLNAIPEEVLTHLSRGQSLEGMSTMTGRTYAWEDAWREMAKNPFIGHGFEADRWLIGEHVHNTYMYALVSGGLPGLVLFVVGLVWAWVLFARLILNPGVGALGQGLTLLQAGGVLAFFTVRSIPEVCGANYSVDYLVMLPAIVYFHVLWRRLREVRLAGGQCPPGPSSLATRTMRSLVPGAGRGGAEFRVAAGFSPYGARRTGRIDVWPHRGGE